MPTPRRARSERCRRSPPPSRPTTRFVGGRTEVEPGGGSCRVVVVVDGRTVVVVVEVVVDDDVDVPGNRGGCRRGRGRRGRGRGRGRWQPGDPHAGGCRLTATITSFLADLQLAECSDSSATQSPSAAVLLHDDRVGHPLRARKTPTAAAARQGPNEGSVVLVAERQLIAGLSSWVAALARAWATAAVSAEPPPAESPLVEPSPGETAVGPVARRCLRREPRTAKLGLRASPLATAANETLGPGLQCPELVQVVGRCRRRGDRAPAREPSGQARWRWCARDAWSTRAWSTRR